ncbi:MAG: hypothetical protein LQ348_001318 [Seirophora lacunosa]|nr:MAG: hypothetical protein LQ348_001318 [Seirophora lacunosa]
MLVAASLIALSGLLSQAVAAPNPIEERGRSLLYGPRNQANEMTALQNNCNRDNLFRAFIDPRYSSSASAFCSTYIRPTFKATATVATTVTPAANGKRDLPVTTYPPSRLSSACSCILTATRSPTTIVTTVVATVTATTATTSPTGCSVATPIVKNGGFESGSLAPWALTQVIPPLPDYEAYLTLGVSSPGFGGSQYAFRANDQVASSYVEINIEQSLTVCAGTKYNFAAKFYITDARQGPQTFVEAFVDDTLIAINKASDAVGPPIVWKTLTGSFTASSNKAQLRIAFIATDYLGVEWAVDDVVVTPATVAA